MTMTKTQLSTVLEASEDADIEVYVKTSDGTHMEITHLQLTYSDEGLVEANLLVE